MELTPQQKRKLGKIAKIVDEGELAIAEYLLELEDKFEETVAQIKKEVPDLDKILERIRGEDGDDYVLTDEDITSIAHEATKNINVDDVAVQAAKKVPVEEIAQRVADKAAQKIKVPIVEKVIEKTEVIKEVPQEIDVEAAVEESLTPKLSEQEERIKKAIKDYTDELFELFKEDSTQAQNGYTDEVKTLQNRTQLLLQIATQRTNTSSTGGSSTDAWNLTGNSGTTPGTNFIGTTDNADFVLKRQGSEYLRFVDGAIKFTNTTFIDTADEEFISYSVGGSMIVGNPTQTSVIVLDSNNVDLSPKSSGTGGVVIRNTKPLRFYETSPSLSNYIGLKPPSSISSSLEFTLPEYDAVRSGGALTSDTGAALSFDYFMRVFGNNTADSTAVANTTAETNFDLSYTVSPSEINVLGRVYIVMASGRCSSTGTPSLTIRLKGGQTASTTLWDSGINAIGAGVTDRPWYFIWVVTVRATGSSGVLYSAPFQTRVDTRTSNNAKSSVAVDISLGTKFEISAQWSAASASNTATLDSFLVIDANKR